MIRHGKTLANEQKLYCGQTDLQLSDNGIRELLDLKKQGIYPGCMGEKFVKRTTSLKSGLYFTSGLLRTEQTLDLLYGSVQREALPQLAEYSFGKFEMKSHAELNEQPDYQAWITDETGLFTCPGGESRNDFLHRVTIGLEVLCTKIKDVESALVICHGGVIASIMEQLFPDKHNFYEWQPKPGRGYTLINLSDKPQYKKI